MCIFSFLSTGPTPKSADHPGDPGQYLPMVFVTYLCTDVPASVLQGTSVHPLGSMARKAWTDTKAVLLSCRHVHVRTCAHTHQLIVYVCAHTCVPRCLKASWEVEEVMGGDKW